MKKVAIIGSGVSGMTAAIYCLKSGFDVTVYEKHSISGGLCTSWTRKGYTFEGAVHWLTNINPDAPLYRLWCDTGILGDSIKTYQDEPYLVFTLNNEEICLYRSIEKIKKHFLQLSPEDSKAIKKLCSDVKAFISFQMPIMDIKGVKTKRKSKMKFSIISRMFPALIKIGGLSKISAKEYAAHFKHPGINKVLSELVVPPDFDSVSLISTIAILINDGVFPEGGSLGLTKRIENKIYELGGKIVFNTKVEKIIVENSETKGVVINGEKKLYESVIITVDTISAQNLFDTPPKDKWIEEVLTKKSMVCTFVGIGVHDNLSNLPRTININEKITVGGIDYDSWGLVNYSGKLGFAPAGCTSITAVFMGDTYNFWNNHKQNGTYNEQKELLASTIAEMIEKHFPQIKGKIEVINIATPLTYERYTGSYHGAWMSVKAKNEKFLMPEPVCSEIKNVFFAGFRTITPGGLPVALYSGFRAAQCVCRSNNNVFEGMV